MLAKLFNSMKRIRKKIAWLWRQEGSPAKRARGIAVGVFSGCFPFFGFQTLIGIGLARLCKGNILLAGLATWISNPFTYLPLFWLNYEVGEFFLGVRKKTQHIPDLSQDEIISQGWLFSSRILIGSSIVGLFLGAFFGVIFYVLFRHLSIKKFK